MSRVIGSGFWRRLRAIVVKEFQQLRRDRLTFAMMLGVPVMQLLLFGYAINTDPHHLPTAVISADDRRVARTIVSALASTGYFDFTHRPASRGRGRRAAAARRGAVRRHHPRATSPAAWCAASAPQILVDADATDPMAAANPLAAGPARASSRRCAATSSARSPSSIPSRAAVELVLQRRYNPEGITASTSCPACWG